MNQIENPYDAISPLPAGLPAEEVVRRYRALNEHEARKGKAPQLNAAYRLLEESGYNRQDGWVFLEIAYPDPPSPEGVEENIQFWRKFIPEEVEILAIQGAFLGGESHDPARGVHSWIKADYMPNNFTLFIRVKPPQLPGSSTSGV